MTARTSKLICAALLVILSWAAQAAEIWYEDNNLGRAGGMPPDFVEKFDRPETFKQASGFIRVYMIRANVLNRMDDRFLTGQLLPYLKKHGMKLAVDAGGATWSQSAGRESVTDSDINLLRRLQRLGIPVDYISLQSVLSKPLRLGGQRVEYPMDKRIEDIVSYSRLVRAIYPQAQIGIIDALPSHGRDYRQPYRQLRDAMARAGMSLAYVHLDMPFDIPRDRRHGITWRTIREVESYLEDDLRLGFGLIATSRTGGRISSKAFHDDVMASLECYAGSKGTPGAFIIASWFPHPQRTIPETATGDDYPAMRTVLEFGRRLEQIDLAGQAWLTQRPNEAAWRTLCNA